MFSKETAHALIDRIPENEYAEKAIKQICAIAKKAGKETRCAKKRGNERASYPLDLREEIGNMVIRNRMAR